MNKATGMALTAIVASSIVASPLNAQGLKFGEDNGGPNGGLKFHNGNASHFYATGGIYVVVKELLNSRICGMSAASAATIGKEALDFYLKRKEPNWPDWNGAFNDLAYGAAGASAAFLLDEVANYGVKSIIQPFKRNKKTRRNQNYKVNLALSQNPRNLGGYRINLNIKFL